MTPEDLIRLRHMLDAVSEALSFVKDKCMHVFVDNRMLTLAVIKELEIIARPARPVRLLALARLPRSLTNEHISHSCSPR